MLSFDKLGRDCHLPKFPAQPGVLFMSMLEGKPDAGVVQKRAVSCAHYLFFRTGFRGRSAVGFSRSHTIFRAFVMPDGDER